MENDDGYSEICDNLNALQQQARAAQRLGVRVELAAWEDKLQFRTVVELRLKQHDHTPYEVEEFGSGKRQRASSGADVALGEHRVYIPDEYLMAATYQLKEALLSLGFAVRTDGTVYRHQGRKYVYGR